MLRHSVPHLSLNSEALRVEWRTQRRALPLQQMEEMKILNISFPRVGIEPKTMNNIILLIELILYIYLALTYYFVLNY